MKWVHRITLTAFAKPEDDAEAIKEGLASFVPFDLEEAKIAINEKKSTGFNDRKILIYTLALLKTNHTNQFLSSFLPLLKEEQKRLLLSQAESRLDENCDFFIRFDKQAWITKRELWLTDTGNCYHLKLTLATYPKKKETAISLLEQLFTQKNI